MAGQRIRYRLVRTITETAEVEMDVSEADLDTLTHGELEKRAIEKVDAEQGWEWERADFRADILYRAKLAEV